MRHVIIGGSIAGISAARAIRSNDRNAEITLLSAERTKPYYRPMISSVLEHGDVDIAFGGDPVESLGIRAVHDTANGIDTRLKEVTLASGSRVGFDKLLIATGSSPVVPEVPGIQGPGVFSFRTVEDARGIQAAARGKKHAAVLGGGFVGIKAAVALMRLGLAVTIIEKLDRILSEKLDKRGSAIVAELLKRGCVDLVTGQQDFEIVRSGGTVRSIRLASGRIIDADLVVTAVGTKPNTGVCLGSGIKINRGIVITDSLETSTSEIYAAGDVVEYRDLISNAYGVSALWSNAEEMGRLAGKNMTGASLRYRGFLSLMNTVEILKVPITTIGMVEPGNAGYEVFTNGSDDSYRKLVFKDDVLKGVLFIGHADSTGVYTYLIKNQIPIGKLKEPAVQGSLKYANFLRPVPPSHA